MTDTLNLATEMTPEGEQIVTPGLRPIIRRDRLTIRLTAPLEPKRPQKPCDHGLFDTDARNQTDWIDEARKAKP